MGKTIIKLEPSWDTLIGSELKKDYMLDLKSFLKEERIIHNIYPPIIDIFNSFNLIHVEDVSVVIVGQDPYHRPGQAHGLAFSVPKGVPTPPSLNNIFSEIESDLGIEMPAHGCLEGWARQGVLLLNTALTVREGSPGSHPQWGRFTDCALTALSNIRTNIVFLLWGAHALKKKSLIDMSKHHILTAPHPSPLSAHRGFFGCRHFSLTNRFLIEQGRNPIDWSAI